MCVSHRLLSRYCWNQGFEPSIVGGVEWFDGRSELVVVVLEVAVVLVRIDLADFAEEEVSLDFFVVDIGDSDICTIHSVRTSFHSRTDPCRI